MTPARTAPKPVSQTAAADHHSYDARDALVEEHLALARRVARRYAGRGEPIDDLTQVAMLGLVKAAERFDPERGHPFAAFAVPTMLGELRRHFRDTCWSVHVPRSEQESSQQVQRASERLTTLLGRAPTVRELAEELGISEGETLEALEVQWAYRATSLDAPSPADDRSWADRLGGVDASLEAIENREAVKRALAALPDRERRILTLRFYGGWTQSQIASELGISQMHVSRLLASTLTKLRLDIERESEPHDDGELQPPD